MDTLTDRVFSAFWDITLAVLPVLIVQGWPDIFTSWLMISGLPLLACRYQIARLAHS